jgi:amino acid permease
MGSRALACTHRRVFVNAMIFINSFGFCSVYFVFIADNTQQVFDEWSGGRGPPPSAWMAIALVPVAQRVQACTRGRRYSLYVSFDISVHLRHFQSPVMSCT